MAGSSFALPRLSKTSALLQAIESEDQIVPVEARGQARHWDSAAWGLTNWKLAPSLPTDFAAALIDPHDESTNGPDELASILNAVATQLPRAPSIAMSGDTVEPVLRRMYGGSAAILAEFYAALQVPTLTPATSAALDNYHARMEVVPSLGEQIVFVDIWGQTEGGPWAPHVISGTEEILDTRRTYYGGDAGTNIDATALANSFTVLPELLAATALELGGNVHALAPAVAARLLGSDPSAEGPTYAELFYLMRVFGYIATVREGSDSEAAMVVRIGSDGGASIRLASYPTGTMTDATFGAGRSVLIEFDAFCEFMRFDGTPIVGDEFSGAHPHRSAELFVADWADDPVRVRDIQRATVGRWYQGDVEPESELMLAKLNDDLQLMESGSPEARGSWEHAMSRLLAGDERKNRRRNARRSGTAPETR